MGYKTKSSRVALDFLKKFQEVCPFKIRVVKTDNGSEFLGEFDRYLKEEGIRHYFNYPRFPKGNGYVPNLPIEILKFRYYPALLFFCSFS